MGKRGREIADVGGAPGEIRTPNPQIRSLVLYPVELRALDVNVAQVLQGCKAGLARGETLAK